MDREERTDPRGVALGLDKEIREVESGFFQLLPTISEIWIENPNCQIAMDEPTERLLRNNNVLFRGTYGSAAEKLARKYQLRFLHLDLNLAKTGNYFESGSYRLTLRLRPDGSACIHEDCQSQGISASSMGGGESSFDLPRDFYLTMSAQQIAERCWGIFYDRMLENGILASFMEKAGKKKGFLLDFTEKPPIASGKTK
jgi:hypothetical protein